MVHIMDTSIIRTVLLCPKVSIIDRLNTIIMDTFLIKALFYCTVSNLEGFFQADSHTF